MAYILLWDILKVTRLWDMVRSGDMAVSSLVSRSQGRQGCADMRGFCIRDLMKYKELMILVVFIADATNTQKQLQSCWYILTIYVLNGFEETWIYRGKSDIYLRRFATWSKWPFCIQYCVNVYHCCQRPYTARNWLAVVSILYSPSQVCSNKNALKLMILVQFHVADAVVFCIIGYFEEYLVIWC